MNRQIYSCCLLATMVLTTVASTGEEKKPRTWTDVTGKHRVKATLVASDDQAVRLRKGDGSVVTVPLARLSAEDRRYLEQSRRGSGARSSSSDADLSQEEIEAVQSMPSWQMRNALADALRFLSKRSPGKRRDALSNLVLLVSLVRGNPQAAGVVEGRAGAVRGMLSDKKPTFRLKAAYVLAALELEDAETLIPVLTTGLASESSEDQTFAAGGVAALGERAGPVVPLLIERLEGQDVSSVERLYVDALGQIGPAAKQAVPVLIEIATDARASHGGNPSLAAVEALGNIGSAAEDAVPALIELLASTRLNISNERREAAGALAKIAPQSTEVVAALTDALQDKNLGVQAAAATALGHIGPAAESAVPLLEAVSGGEDAMLADVARTALQRIQAPAGTGTGAPRGGDEETAATVDPIVGKWVPTTGGLMSAFEFKEDHSQRSLLGESNSNSIWERVGDDIYALDVITGFGQRVGHRMYMRLKAPNLLISCDENGNKSGLNEYVRAE